MNLNLKRPLIFFDLETTGTNITTDRIVEFSYLKLYPDGSKESKTRKINPEVSIPASSTAIHHITDDDVKDAPTFRQVSKSLKEIFDDSDIAGYNSNKFDVPLLIEEFARAGITFDLSGRHFIDVQNIFHKMEQRTLVAAYKFYCGKELTGAHSANADTEATYEVLLKQIERYPELTGEVEKLAEFSRAGRGVDLAARFVLDENDVPIFNFGKHKGKPVKEIFRREPSFYAWMMQGEFGRNTKDVATRYYNEVRNGNL